MISDIKAKVRQSVVEVSGESDLEYLKTTRLGQMLTADWRENLLMAGVCWVIDVGSMTAGGDIIKYSGGGMGTTIDNDQPEIVIGVDSGYYLIPLEIMVGASPDFDADAELAHILAIADRTTGVPTTGVSTAGLGGVATPLNLLDGAGSFPGRAFTLISTDIADPTVDEILDFETLIVGASTGGFDQLAHLKMEYEPASPTILAGPCGLYVYWGGTGIVYAMARVVVAAVPSAWYE